MKSAIIVFNSLYRCPYANIYMNHFKSLSMDFDVIELNRAEYECSEEINRIVIKWNHSKNKLWNFYNFQKKASKILKKNQYKYVVVLTTIPAVLLCKTLVKKYNKKYILDVRDYTLENHFIFRILERKLTKHSLINVISSPGFKFFLPKGNYYLCHNMSYDNVGKSSFDKKTSLPIVIGYVGSIAYKKECIDFIKLVERDDRFIFSLYGEEVYGNEVNDFLKTFDHPHTKVFGKYDSKEKQSILNQVDILFNVYGFNRPLLTYALSNKLYDSFYYKKPLLTSPHTEMSSISGKYSFDVDFSNSNIMDNIFEWYRSIDSDFNEYANEKLQTFLEDNKIFYEKLKELIW